MIININQVKQFAVYFEKTFNTILNETGTKIHWYHCFCQTGNYKIFKNKNIISDKKLRFKEKPEGSRMKKISKNTDSNIVLKEPNISGNTSNSINNMYLGDTTLHLLDANIVMEVLNAPPELVHQPNNEYICFIDNLLKNNIYKGEITHFLNTHLPDAQNNLISLKKQVFYEHSDSNFYNDKTDINNLVKTIKAREFELANKNV